MLCNTLCGLNHDLQCIHRRYLVEAPPNICTPTHIAQAAEKVQQAAPDVFSIEVLEREECQKMNMGLYLGVSECSEEPPKFIHLTYKSPGKYLIMLWLFPKVSANSKAQL